MNAPRPAFVVFCLAALYGLGLASGWLLFGRVKGTELPLPAASTEERWAKTTLAEYRDRLELTPAQIETIKPLFAATRDELRVARAEATGRILGVVKGLNESVSRELTVEQRRKLVELVNEKQALRARSSLKH
jgi:hypothetical protein